MRATRESSSATVVWIAPGASAFSCLCEACLDRAPARGASFLEAVRDANVRGTLAADADVGFARCRAGHRLVIRRTRRIRGPADRSGRQLVLGAAAV